MRFLIFIWFCSFIGCSSNQEPDINHDNSKEVTPLLENTLDTLLNNKNDTSIKNEAKRALPNVYYNQRFKNVRVQKQGDNKYLVTGQGQIFEASFSWVVEDGHEDLQKGFATTDEGAPEWGNFKFTVEAVKKRPNSTLHLILFEASAKDGSRQYELPIVLD